LPSWLDAWSYPVRRCSWQCRGRSPDISQACVALAVRLVPGPLLGRFVHVDGGLPRSWGREEGRGMYQFDQGAGRLPPSAGATRVDVKGLAHLPERGPMVLCRQPPVLHGLHLPGLGPLPDRSHTSPRRSTGTAGALRGCSGRRARSHCAAAASIGAHQAMVSAGSGSLAAHGVIGIYPEGDCGRCDGGLHSREHTGAARFGPGVRLRPSCPSEADRHRSGEQASRTSRFRTCSGR